jgi:hypothetical protein
VTFLFCTHTLQKLLLPCAVGPHLASPACRCCWLYHTPLHWLGSSDLKIPVPPVCPAGAAHPEPTPRKTFPRLVLLAQCERERIVTRDVPSRGGPVHGLTLPISTSLVTAAHHNHIIKNSITWCLVMIRCMRSGSLCVSVQDATDTNTSTVLTASRRSLDSLTCWTSPVWLRQPGSKPSCQTQAVCLNLYQHASSSLAMHPPARVVNVADEQQ